MNRFFCHTLWGLPVLVLLCQTAGAQTPAPRTERPVSVMFDGSLGGPNGTLGVRLNVDVQPWVGLSVGTGYSTSLDASKTSISVDLRPLRRRNSNADHAYQVSLGLGYRGQHEETIDNCGFTFSRCYDETQTTADYTLLYALSMGYAYAAKTGLRAHVFLGSEIPITHGNETTIRRYKEDNYTTNCGLHEDCYDAEIIKTSASPPPISLFAGVSLGYAF